MSLKKYAIRDINRNPELHKKLFVTHEDMMVMLNGFIMSAIETGADEEKLMLSVSSVGKDKH